MKTKAQALQPKRCRVHPSPCKNCRNGGRTGHHSGRDDAEEAEDDERAAIIMALSWLL